MRKILIILLLVMLSFSLSAQTYDQFSDAFTKFATTTAGALPFNSLVGLNWSDAYIGNFPHFGAGLTLGLTTIPLAGVSEAVELLGVSKDAIPKELQDLNLVPLPAFMAEGRIGGFVLPFDIGVKLGMLPENFVIPVANIALDYLLAGIDFRYALIKGALAIPTISVGGGLNYLKGGVAIGGILGSNISLGNFGGQTLELTDPSLALEWETLTIDVKAQASWSLLILNAYVGAGASYGVIAKAGGGMESKVKIGGSEITPQQISDIETITGESLNLDATGVKYMASVPAAWSMRVFGGTSINLLILKLDIGAMYNILDQSIGASLNIRIQL